MVYIKRIDLRGFKTFGRKVSLGFDRGFTVITGPNGSGKSNILDSVKFALGELSPKELRGGNFSDLIYKGQSSAIKSAYVAIQFDNTDRRIPIQSDTVTISREFRRGGEGIYRLNGRRISRKQLTDVLSSADIQVTGYNIVPQHAVTRLAEVTPEERRRIIEDMIGIAVYDSKKAEAQAQLQVADLNLKVASARIDEVRIRVESLERERNDYLRSLQLRKEIEQIQAKLISQKIERLKSEIKDLNQHLQEREKRLESLKARRDEFAELKSKVESERRSFEEASVNRGSSELFDVERAIGDVNAQIAALRSQIATGEMTLKSLVKQKEQLSEHQTQIEALVTKTRTELRSLKEMQEKLVALLKEKSLQLQNSQKSLEEMRSNLGQSTKEAEQLDFQIENLDKQLTHFDAQLKGSETKLQLLEGHLTRLRTKSAEYDRLRKEVETRLSEIATLRKTEEDRLRDLEESLVKIITLKKEKKEDLAHATEVVRKARITLAELEIRKSITDELAAEEKALQIIEDLGKEGVIQGILGRLSEFLKVGEQHRKAVEAASAGWMKALIVRDIEVAIKCFEFLRRARLGRIKIIPLKNVSPAKPRPVPEDLPGILGPLASFVESERALRPAINFVFGDTLLANGQRSALLASMKGFRAVTPTGDLYETGGGMEIGYYRVPLDLSSLVPRETAMKELLGAVDSLETLLERGRDDLKRLDEEEARLSEARSTSQNMLRALENEQEMISENLERMKKVSEEMLRRLEVLEKTKREEKFLIDEMSSQKNSIQEKLVALQRSRASLRIRSRSVSLLEVENKHASLEAELNELSRQSVGNESRISTLESSLTTLLPGLEQTRTQLKTIESQIMRLTSQLEACRQQLESLQARCKELQAKRERLAENLANVRARRTEFEDQLKRLEDGLMATLNEIEPVKDEILRFTASIKQKEMEIEFHIHELRSLGFQEPIQVPSDEVSSLEPTLSSLKNELDGIGAVNQLAVTQYEDQKNVYMQLSSRISDLEKEKLAIIDFMNELDRKKRDSFMKAFEQVNATLQEIFSAVTGGGKARMVLEFPDDPFKGGVDMFLKFPGRSEMTIASASGGEKSVGTVCFILALQTIHPMPFYIFDEIDAHLDALNSQRLADLLREKAKGSQFIVISLKDTCISRANKVHGVFIQDGVSQVVSLPAVEVGKNGKP